jgi:hypothetical protein
MTAGPASSRGDAGHAVRESPTGAGRHHLARPRYHRRMLLPRLLRPLVLALVVAAGVAAAPGGARADSDIGIGLFLGQPTGLDLKIGLGRRSALDIVLGYTDFDDDFEANYAHVTYLVTPFAARGRSVLVPFRLGIGGAFYDDGGDFGDGANVAVRAPLQIGFVFRSVPLELYGEIALKVTFIDEYDNRDEVDFDGGIGFRIYF